MRNKIMHKGKLDVEFLCDGLVIAQNRTNFSPALISSFRVTERCTRASTTISVSLDPNRGTEYRGATLWNSLRVVSDLESHFRILVSSIIREYYPIEKIFTYICYFIVMCTVVVLSAYSLSC